MKNYTIKLTQEEVYLLQFALGYALGVMVQRHEPWVDRVNDLHKRIKDQTHGTEKARK